MDRQEKHQQKKEKERNEKNKAEHAYESEQQKRRLPINSISIILIGMLLIFAVIYVWTVGLARPW